MRPLFATLGFAAVSLGASVAGAVDLPPIDDKPLRLDVTETSIFNWHFDNRNDLRDDDRYGEWIQRLDTKLTWSKLTFGFRLDSATYWLAPTAPYLAEGDLTRFSQYQKTLVNRYQTSVYPSKLHLTYSTPELELTAGDFYVQFGRGLVLSLRKIDEVAVDTTLRGGKVEWHGRSDDFRYGATFAFGYTNPVRVDEASGRRLVAPRSWGFAGMPSPVSASSLAAEPNIPQHDYGYAGVMQPTFRPDGIVGTRIEAGTSDLLVGVQGSVLARGGLGALASTSGGALSDVTLDTGTLGRKNRFIETGSVSMSMPKLPGATALYLEVAGQKLDMAASPFGSTNSEQRNTSGHAIYASLSTGGDPVNLLVELRHTRRFWPLLANVSPLAAQEFAILAYSAPPTTEPVTNDTELGFFGTCTTGGRARLDVALTKSMTAYAAVGRYATWAERVGGDCAASGGALSDADRNDVWDPFVGVQASYDAHRSHVNAWTGVRLDQTPLPFATSTGSESRLYYRETYLRYDWFHVLSDAWAVQDQGVHRLRAEYQTDASPWHEGENYVALQWRSKLIFGVGYEYYDRGGAWRNYVNGSALWRITPDTSLRAFVGQQRPALRCVSGVCRQFPPFEGGKVELVIRF